ncbi:MAG: methyltransferase domain-containing protein [Bacillota bacterium]|nr:methyltransferase domain-containing protein [Bacillota bacterium]
MIRDYFNGLAARWDERITPQTITRLEEIVAAHRPPPGARVLDVGCGTGVLTPLLLAAVGEEGEVVGVDFAPAMLTVARAKGFDPRATFVEADVADLPFPDGHFDAVFCYSALPHFPDIPAALSEMRRVLVPGGNLTICHTESREAINRLHREVVGRPVRDHLLPTAAELEATLSAGGFRDVTVFDGNDRFIAAGRRT